MIIRQTLILAIVCFAMQDGISQVAIAKPALSNPGAAIKDLSIKRNVIIQDVTYFTKLNLEPGPGHCHCQLSPSLAFEGKRDDAANVQLEWKAFNEPAISGYRIERAFDKPEHFETIGYLPPEKGDLQQKKYTLPDENKYSGITYYRLTQWKTKAGEMLQADTVAIKGLSVPGKLQIYPNPARSVVMLVAEMDTPGMGQLQVVDAGNRILLQRKQNWQKGANTVSIPVSSMASGMYMVQITGSNGQPLTRKFIKL